MIYRAKEASPTGRGWNEEVKTILKTELKRRKVTYNELAERLTAMGVEETERNIRTKISRGNFTAVFFLQCLAAIGSRNLRFDWYDDERVGLDLSHLSKLPQQ